MDDLITKYWPQMVTAFLGAMWLARVDARGRAIDKDLEELRKELLVAQAKVALQDVTMARIGESLNAIKVTLDRLYDRTERGLIVRE